MENFYAGTAAFCPDRLACQRGAAVLYWEKVKGDEPMCDTLGFVGKDRAIFGKNSDRSPNEPQLLEYTAALLRFDTLVEHTFVEGQRLPIAHEKKAMQKLTYCSVEQSGGEPRRAFVPPLMDVGRGDGRERLWTVYRQ